MKMVPMIHGCLSVMKEEGKFHMSNTSFCKVVLDHWLCYKLGLEVFSFEKINIQTELND